MYRTIGLSCLFLFAWLVVSAQEDTRIQVHMDANVKICVGEKIVLTCPDSIPARKVLTYEWFEYRGANDSVMISTGRSVTVQPLRETSYRLIIQYLDMDNNLYPVSAANGANCAALSSIGICGCFCETWCGKWMMSA